MFVSVVLPLVILSFRAEITQAKAVNRTIDDEEGDSLTRVVPAYTPSGGRWTLGNQCPVCSISSLFVHASHAHNGTWHDATYGSNNLEVNVAFNFTGTAVYVYNILVNQLPYPVLDTVTTFTNLTFHIDDELVGSFVHNPDNTTNILYNYLVYSNTSLENKHHTMEMRAEGDKPSLVLFDYAEYTTNDSDGDDSDEESSGDEGETSPVPISTTVVSPSTAPNNYSSGPASSGSLAGAAAQPSTSSTKHPHHPPPSGPGSHHETVAWIVGGVLLALGSVAILVVVLLKRRHRRREPELASPNRAAVEPYPFIGHGHGHGQPAGDAEIAFGYGPPAWGAAGSAPSTGRAAVLVEQIRTLEGRLRALQLERDYGDGYPREKHGDWRRGGGGGAAGSSGADKPPLTPTEAGARTSRGEGLVEEEMGMEAQIGALAREIEALQAELRREQRLGEELPPYA